MTVFDDKLDRRVAPAIAAAMPGVVIGYHLVVSYIDEHGDEVFKMAAPEGQRATFSRELLGVGIDVTDLLAARMVDEMMGEDDDDR